MNPHGSAPNEQPTLLHNHARYDDFNRLATANTTGQAYTYAYDRFGNRWQQNGPHTLDVTFSGNNNRIDGYSYDADGNLLSDGSHTYAYDAENHIVSVDSSATKYVYDANGRRVEKTVGGVSVDYLYDLAGHQVAEVNSSGGANREEVYAGGQHVATYANNTTYFDHADWLGTERVRTNTAGALCESITSLPFGDGEATTGSCSDASPMHFTGKQRDSESNLDNFGARYYGSQLGQFMSPDPLQPDKKHQVMLDQFVNDPQSWNKYAYSLENPVTYHDRDGHFTGDDHERIEMNAMLAAGYSQRAAHIAAVADVRMDNLGNVLSGVRFFHHFTATQENPQHGERADGQTKNQAQAAAMQFISSKTTDAAERALQGDVAGALADIGQASHTAQDIVRHNFERAGQHPWHEAPASQGEMQAAEAATTNEVLDQFTDDVYSMGFTQGLSYDQISQLMLSVIQGNVQPTMGPPPGTATPNVPSSTPPGNSPAT